MMDALGEDLWRDDNNKKRILNQVLNIDQYLKSSINASIKLIEIQ